MMKKLALAALVFALGSVTALAADFNGKWTADVPGRGGNTQTINFDFHVDGMTLTGKVTTMRGDLDITNGKVDGDNISFDTVMSFNGNSMTASYMGKADGDTIKFSRSMAGGNMGGGGARPPVEFVAKKGSGTIPAPPQ